MGTGGNKGSSAPDFGSLSDAEQREVAERLLRIEQSGWKPFWCADSTCDGNPHWLLDQNGDVVFLPTGLPIPDGIIPDPEFLLGYVDDDGYDWGIPVLDPQWAHNHARADQRLLPWQEAWVLFIMSGRGAGKALALDTPIPTPTGWTTMGDLKVGDTVFGGDGKPTEVTFATEVQHGRTCYEVEFSDGATIIADADHLWQTSTHAQRKQGYRTNTPVERDVLTTEAIKDTLTYGKRGDTNHCVWVMPGLETKEATLPLDPYTFGFWLGDGASDDARITVSDADFAEVSALMTEQLSSPTRKPGAACATYRVGSRPPKRDVLGAMTSNGSTRSVLRDMGVLGNKHMPAAYLRSSYDQRLALLRGLMDSDGYADAKGRVEFCSTRRVLAEAVWELALSLGQKAVLKEGRATLRGKDCGPKYRVMWQPTEQVFGLTRKANRVRFDRAQVSRNYQRMIVAVREVESVPVRCITVQTESHTYLAGREMIVTHNTTTGVEFVTLSARKGLDGAILGRRGTELVNTHVATILARAHPDFMPIHWASKDILEWPNGAITYLFSAEKPENIRSVNLSYAWVDEAAFMDEIETAWMNLKLATRIEKPGNPIHFLITSTPTPTKWVMEMEDDDDVVIRRVSTYANKANLSESFLRDLEKNYEGTRMGRQELHGEVLRDVEGAMWNDDLFRHLRVDETGFADLVASMDDCVVAIDPAGSKGKRSDATGIIMVGAQHFDEDGNTLDGSRFYVLGRATLKGTPSEWATQAFKAARLINANRIVAEKNFGGDMVKQVLEDHAKLHPDEAVDADDEKFKIDVVHAQQSKETRAEATVGKYEQGRVCVDGEALVPTHRGVIPLHEVSVNDFVLTRAGLRRVTATWDQGVRDVVEVVTTEGSTLMTADHEVYTSTRGWVHACDLVPTDTVVTWERYASIAGQVQAAGSRNPVVTLARPGTCGVPANRSASFRSTGASAITSRMTGTGVPDDTLVGNSCTVRFGEQSEGRSPRDGISTTSTMTRATTSWGTWNRSLRAITQSTITRRLSVSGFNLLRTLLGGLRRRGHESGTTRTWCATSASLRFDPSNPMPVSALPPVTRAGGIVSVRDAGKRQVYDISVEGEHEFFANGFLVHNCHVTSPTVFGDLSELEKQQVTWVPKSRGGRSPSPNDIDALVWAVRALETKVKFKAQMANSADVLARLQRGRTSPIRQQTAAQAAQRVLQVGKPVAPPMMGQPGQRKMAGGRPNPQRKYQIRKPRS